MLPILILLGTNKRIHASSWPWIPEKFLVWISVYGMIGLQTALQLEARTGKADMVELLVQRGADRSTRGSHRECFGSRAGDTALGIAKSKGYEDIVMILEEDGKPLRHLIHMLIVNLNYKIYFGNYFLGLKKPKAQGTFRLQLTILRCL